MDAIWQGKSYRTQSFWFSHNPSQTQSICICLYILLFIVFNPLPPCGFTFVFLFVFGSWRASQSISARNLLLPYFHFAIFHFSFSSYFWQFPTLFHSFLLCFFHLCVLPFFMFFQFFISSPPFFLFFLSFWHLSVRRHPLQAHQIDVPEKKVQTSVGSLCFPFSLSRSLVFILLFFCFQVINISFLWIVWNEIFRVSHFSFLFMFFQVFHLRLPSCFAHCLYLPQFSSHVCCSFHFPFFHVCLFSFSSCFFHIFQHFSLFCYVS